LTALAADPARRDEHRAVVAPLTEDTFKIQFTANRAFREKLRQAAGSAAGMTSIGSDSSAVHTTSTRRIRLTDARS
jgi:hypothetical protein